MSSELTSKNDIWNPYFYKRFAGFHPLLSLWQQAEKKFPVWPQIADYNQLKAFAYHADFFVVHPLKFVEQSKNSCYEQEISVQRQIPTRLKNWHDFFNNLTWLCWPRLKWALVTRSIQEKTTSGRNHRQNLLAHFDECGLVICADEPHIFSLIQNFQWQRLFRQTPALLKHCLPVLIGHGLMEKLLNPFIGITAKVIFLKVSSDFFAWETSSQMQLIDEKLAQYILGEDLALSPQALCPFPLLGWPNWYPKQDEIFFNNKNYFREKRISSAKEIAEPIFL